MARPTEPGWYWLQNNSGGWEIVHVEPVDWWDELAVWSAGWEGPSKVSHYTDDRWGGRITQQPVTDPPPPF